MSEWSMAEWLMYASAALICLIVIVSSTPNAWADSILAKFDVHPKISPDSTVSVNGVELAGKDKQQFIEDFNNAIYRYTYNLTHKMPSYEGMDLRVTAQMARKTVNFILHPHEDHIDIVKEMGKKVTQYRVESSELQRSLFTSSN